MEVTEYTFFCTGRGTHRRREIGPAVEQSAMIHLLERFGYSDDDHGERSLTNRPSRTRTTEAGQRVTSRSDSLWIENTKGGPLWHFRCVTCKSAAGNPRHVQRNHQDINAVLAAVESTGNTARLDVSMYG